MTDKNYGIARRVVHEELPDIPVAFAEFLLGIYYEPHTTSGTVYVVSKHDALEWLRDYFYEFEAGFEDVMAAKEWLDAMPEFVGDMLIDISHLPVAYRKPPPTEVWVTLEYIDCCCDEDYIKLAPARESITAGSEIVCAVCGATFDDCPNSRLSEVRDAGLPFDEHKIEYASKA